MNSDTVELTQLSNRLPGVGNDKSTNCSSYSTSMVGTLVGVPKKRIDIRVGREVALLI